jgi:glyoxylase-like metal-dependent hydrolase (beta-lactamase superfamily II)
MKILDDLHAFLWLDPTANNCNAYLINGEKRILVDPGHYHLFSHVQDGLSRLSLDAGEIDTVIITHGHPDHMEAVTAFLDNSSLIAIPATEMDFIKRVARYHGNAFGISDFEPHILLHEGELRVGNVNLQVIQTPGHSPGSICLYWPERKVLFTGDVVFNQGIGRTDLPGGNGQELKESIKRISRLDVEYLLPGHGEIVSGREAVKANFANIERDWFAYL